MTRVSQKFLSGTVHFVRTKAFRGEYINEYINETRILNLNLLESKRYCLPWRRIVLKLLGATRSSSAG